MQWVNGPHIHKRTFVTRINLGKLKCYRIQNFVGRNQVNNYRMEGKCQTFKVVRCHWIFKVHYPRIFCVESHASLTTKFSFNSTTQTEAKNTTFKSKPFTKKNSSLFLLEGSNKWTPRKMGILPTEVGNPTKVMCEACDNPLAHSQYDKEKITSKPELRVEGIPDFWIEDPTSCAHHRDRQPAVLSSPTAFKKPNNFKVTWTLFVSPKRNVLADPTTFHQAIGSCGIKLREVSTRFSWTWGESQHNRPWSVQMLINPLWTRMSISGRERRVHVCKHYLMCVGTPISHTGISKLANFICSKQSSREQYQSGRRTLSLLKSWREDLRQII